MFGITNKTKYWNTFCEYSEILGNKQDSGKISDERYYFLFDKLTEWKNQADKREKGDK